VRVGFPENAFFAGEGAIRDVDWVWGILAVARFLRHALGSLSSDEFRKYRPAGLDSAVEMTFGWNMAEEIRHLCWISIENSFDI